MCYSRFNHAHSGTWQLYSQPNDLREHLCSSVIKTRNKDNIIEVPKQDNNHHHIGVLMKVDIYHVPSLLTRNQRRVENCMQFDQHRVFFR